MHSRFEIAAGMEEDVEHACDCGQGTLEYAVHLFVFVSLSAGGHSSYAKWRCYMHSTSVSATGVKHDVERMCDYERRPDARLCCAVLCLHLV